VLAAVGALRAGDVARLGRLMNESHASLRDDFEVTNEQLDTMAQIARAQPGCFGARMTGGGFGGCAVALVALDEVRTIEATIAARYESSTGLRPQLFVTGAADGTAAG
jgi:galactokinase